MNSTKLCRLEKKPGGELRPTPPRAAELPPVLVADEVAALLRVDRKTVYSMVERGKLPGCRRIGRCLRFSRDAIVRWLGADGPRPTEE